MDSHHLTSRVQTHSLLCKNECGFYGNPSWDGYCSVCYRAAFVNQNSRQSSTSSVSVSAAAAIAASSKTEPKKPNVSERGANTLKNIFKFSKDSNREKNNAFPEECHIAVDELNAFLDNFRGSVGADVSRQISKLLENLETMGGSHINQYSLAIQNFYQNISKRISSSPLYSNLSTTDKDLLSDNIERFVTSWIYCWAFASPITDDEEVDIKLQEKIRSLHWITPCMLDSPIDPTATNEMAHLDTATFSLMRVNAVLASEDKLTQIVQCSKSVFAALKVHNENSIIKDNLLNKSKDVKNSLTSNNMSSSNANQVTNQQHEWSRKVSTNADDFLPTLIWIIIKSNPPLLYSNMQFIVRFANQNRLNTGEPGYFFTNFSCAVHFLRNLTHKSLSLTEEEFFRCVRTGMPIVKRSGTLCEGEKLFHDNEIRLLDLEDKMNSIDQKLDSAVGELKDFHTKCQQTMNQMRLDWPLSLDTSELDSRQIENPHILLLGPKSSSNNNNNNNKESTVSNSSVLASLFDNALDEPVNPLLPEPLKPTPIKRDDDDDNKTV